VLLVIHAAGAAVDCDPDGCCLWHALVIWYYVIVVDVTGWSLTY